MELIYNDTYYKFDNNILLEDEESNTNANAEKNTASLKDKIENYKKLSDEEKSKDSFALKLQKIANTSTSDNQQKDTNLQKDIEKAINISNIISKNLSAIKHE